MMRHLIIAASLGAARAAASASWLATLLDGVASLLEALDGSERDALDSMAEGDVMIARCVACGDDCLVSRMCERCSERAAKGRPS
jgi:hypothetical protein